MIPTVEGTHLSIFIEVTVCTVSVIIIPSGCNFVSSYVPPIQADLSIVSKSIVVKQCSVQMRSSTSTSFTYGCLIVSSICRDLLPCMNLLSLINANIVEVIVICLVSRWMHDSNIACSGDCYHPTMHRINWN